MHKQFSRRSFLKTVAAGSVFAMGHAIGQPKGRVVILGFDGVEPTIVERMLSAGQLPNLARLREGGVYSRLHTTNPPQSPTAWSSFGTCKNPGGHGIYDFLRRDPDRYRPAVGLGDVKHPELDASGAIKSKAQFITNRKGDTFWKIADNAGLRSKVLFMPFMYPPDDLKHGLMFSGLGVPDLRGTSSTCFYFSDSFSDAEKKDRMSGGIRIPLDFDGDTVTAKIPTARDPRQRSTYVEFPVTLTVDRAKKTATVAFRGQTVSLKEGEWSKWLEWSFPVTSNYSVRSVSRFCAIELGNQVRLYMTCLQFHPSEPYIDFTWPAAYSADLQQRYGLYKTIGWAFDTHALRQGALTEEAFLQDIRETMAWRAKVVLDELQRGDFDLMVGVWTATDRVAHMFWRYMDPKHPLFTEEGRKLYGHVLDDTYIAMDRIVGRVMERLGDDDLLMVLSDHGFHSFRVGFNVNTWLIRNGYLAVAGETDPETATNETPFLRGYDWSRTKAYALGLGSVFLNLKGREGEGTVEPGEADALIAEIREKLLSVTDPKTGDKVFNSVYTRDIYSGPYTDDAPDLQLGYAEGYQSTKGAASGKAPAELFEVNDDKWSGDHAASDVALSPGIFFSNSPLNTDTLDIRDLGVTALTRLGVAIPEDLEGKPLA